MIIIQTRLVKLHKGRMNFVAPPPQLHETTKREATKDAGRSDWASGTTFYSGGLAPRSIVCLGHNQTFEKSWLESRQM
jgi:hypothetical protein